MSLKTCTESLLSLPRLVSRKAVLWLLSGGLQSRDRKLKNQEIADRFSAFFDVLFSAVLVALILRATVVQAYFIPSASMRNTLLEDDYLLANKVAYSFFSLKLADVKRGDIIIFECPNDGRDFIKRVVALPGEYVEVKNNRVYIDGRAIKEPYLKEKMYGLYKRKKVPEDHVFALGDNRNNSHDSRYWGFLPMANIKAKALLVYFPPHRVRMVGHYNWEDK